MRDKKRSPNPAPSDKPVSKKRSPFRLLSVRIAIVLTVLGGGLWIYSLATAPTAATSSQSGASGGAGLASGMAPRQSGSAASTSTEKRPIDSAAPAILRFGASFLGAFMIGYFLRKFLRWTLLIVAILAVGIYFLRRSGVIDLPWDQIEDGVEGGTTWLQAQAGSIKDFLTGYLPSSVAAIVGGFIGFIRG